MDHFEEVSEWLGSNSSTPKHANLSLISNVETPSFTSLIAEPVSEPFTLNTAEFLIRNDEETKNSENRVLLNIRHESSGIKIESNWSSASSTSSQHLTVNTSEYSCKNITTTLIQISRLFYFGFFFKTSHLINSNSF